MGYAEEKAKVEKVRRKVIYVVAAVLFAVITALCIFSAFVPPATWKFRVQLPKVSARGEGELRMHFIDVGQGDCTLIELPDGKTMLVDGGNTSSASSKAIMRYLYALKIDALDYILVTHADGDHCGGLDTVLQWISVDTVFVPNVSPTENAAFAQFYKELNKEGCAVRYNSRDISLSVTDGPNAYTLQFLYPHTDEEMPESIDDHNVYSAVFWLDYYGTSALFTGDAPFSIEETLMREANIGFWSELGIAFDSTEILKVAHHGSKNSTSEAFVRYLNTQTAVISCGAGNKYDHPSIEVKNTLSTVGARTYRTDTQGSVVITVQRGGAYRVETLRLS